MHRQGCQTWPGVRDTAGAWNAGQGWCQTSAWNAGHGRCLECGTRLVPDQCLECGTRPMPGMRDMGRTLLVGSNSAALAQGGAWCVCMCATQPRMRVPMLEASWRPCAIIIIIAILSIFSIAGIFFECLGARDLVWRKRARGGMISHHGSAHGRSTHRRPLPGWLQTTARRRHQGARWSIFRRPVAQKVVGWQRALVGR
eukprot:313264-Chlamydomonas_euryale.AAC.3